MPLSASYQENTHKLKLSNGCNISYIDEGKGDHTLLFIHGLANYSLCWKKNIDFLKQYYRCIAIDLPGNGFSDHGNFSYSINFFAGAVYDFIKLSGIKNVVLIGHSMGGQVALNLLINQPDAAKKLVLCAPAGFEKFSQFEISMYHNSLKLLNMLTTEENGLRHTIQSSFFHFPAQAEDMINELVDIMRRYPIREYQKMVEACIHTMLSQPVYDSLPLVTTPAMVIFGEQDALIPNKIIHHTTTRKLAEECVKRMRNATLKMIPQCGHFVQWEKANEVNNYIREFVQ